MPMSRSRQGRREPSRWDVPKHGERSSHRKRTSRLRLRTCPSRTPHCTLRPSPPTKAASDSPCNVCTSVWIISLDRTLSLSNISFAQDGLIHIGLRLCNRWRSQPFQLRYPSGQLSILSEGSIAYFLSTTLRTPRIRTRSTQAEVGPHDITRIW